MQDLKGAALILHQRRAALDPITTIRIDYTPDLYEASLVEYAHTISLLSEGQYKPLSRGIDNRP
jgi:hypothetical protein